MKTNDLQTSINKEFKKDLRPAELTLDYAKFDFKGLSTTKKEQISPLSPNKSPFNPPSRDHLLNLLFMQKKAPTQPNKTEVVNIHIQHLAEARKEVFKRPNPPLIKSTSDKKLLNIRSIQDDLKKGYDPSREFQSVASNKYDLGDVGLINISTLTPRYTSMENSMVAIPKDNYTPLNLPILSPKYATPKQESSPTKIAFDFQKQSPVKVLAETKGLPEANVVSPGKLKGVLPVKRRKLELC